MKITVLVDNRSIPGFAAEFGLSLLLEHERETWLFDTGAGTALTCNLKQCGIPPEGIRKMILSHGHYDHSGGLAKLRPEEIWCCRGILAGHYSRHADSSVHQIAMPEDSQTVFRKTRIHWTDHFLQLENGWFLTGPIPRHSGEDCGGDFYHDECCRTPDDVPEEQALLTPDGMLITGCCHAGIINTVEYCRKIHPEIPVRAVMGGLHLKNADPARLKRTAEFFRTSEIRNLYLLHCTGEAAVEYLQTELSGCRVLSPAPGESIIPG